MLKGGWIRTGGRCMTGLHQHMRRVLLGWIPFLTDRSLRLTVMVDAAGGPRTYQSASDLNRRLAMNAPASPNVEKRIKLEGYG